MSLKDWFKSLYKTAEIQAEPIIDDLNKLRGIKKKPTTHRTLRDKV